MRKFFTLLLLLILLVPMRMQAQQVVYNALQMKPSLGVNHEQYDYFQHDNNTVFVAKQQPAQVDVENSGVVKIIAHYDANEMRGHLLALLDSTTQRTSYDLLKGDTISTFDVPNGTYDLVSSFTPSRNTTYRTIYYVIKENIVVNGDTAVVEINPHEATIELKTPTYAPDGTLWDVPIYGYDENNEEYYEDNGNAYAMYVMNYISYEPLQKLVTCSMSTVLYRPRGYESVSDVYDMRVSPVSEKFIFTQTKQHIDKNNLIPYFNKYEFRGTAIDSLSNDPNDYCAYTEHFVLPVENDPNMYYGGCNDWNIYANYFRNGWSANGSIPLSADGAVTVYIDVPQDKKLYSDDFRTFLSPLYTNIETVTDDEGNNSYRSYPIYGPLALVKRNDVEYFVLPTTDVFFMSTSTPFVENDNSSNAIDDNGHPILHYTSKQRLSDDKFGNSAAYNVFKMYSFQRKSTTHALMEVNYLGKLGETRECDLSRATVELTYNNQYIGQIDINSLSDFSFTYAWKAAHPEDGVFDFSLTDTTIYVDGIHGKNITKVHFDQNKNDKNAPTLRYLQFRNRENIVTDHFNENALDGGYLYLVCADIDNLNDGRTCYKPTVLEVSYTAMGSDDWQSLTMTEMPEYGYYNYGYTYRASMGEVVPQKDVEWYDLKIKVVDEDGNYQEQVISPAFKVAATGSGISELNATASEGLKAVYDVAGRLIANGITSTDNLPAGLYIVKDLKNGDVKKIMVK